MRLVPHSLRRFISPSTSPAFACPALIEGLEDRRLFSVSPAVDIVATPPKTPIVIQSITPIGVLIHAEASESFTGIVGRVKGLYATALGADLLQHSKHFQAIIDWGDGSAAANKGTIYVNSGESSAAVGGTHTYAKAGNYAITVTIETIPPVVDPPTAMVASLVLTTIHSTADVSNDSEGGVHLIETATQKFTAVLGRFDYPNVDLALSATITWGDGTSSTGVVERGSGATLEDWVVVGTHTYSHTGHFKVHIGVLGRPIGAPGLVTTPIILYLASIDSTIDVLGHA